METGNGFCGFGGHSKGQVLVSRAAENMASDKHWCPGRRSTLVESSSCVKGALGHCYRQVHVFRSLGT